MSSDPSPTPTRAALRQRKTSIFNRSPRRSRRLVHTDFVTIGPASARSSLEAEAIFRARASARAGVFIAVFVALFFIGAGWALKIHQLNTDVGAVGDASADATVSSAEGTEGVSLDTEGGQATAESDPDIEGFVGDSEARPPFDSTGGENSPSPSTPEGSGNAPSPLASGGDAGASAKGGAAPAVSFGTLPPTPVAADDDRPMLAIVIDDWGYGWHTAPDFLAFDEPLTVAVLPYLPFTQSHAEAAAQAGHQVILHLPMEPLGAQWDTSDHMITTALPGDRIADEVRRALSNIPFVTGVNNHMGSKATADRRVVTEVLKEVQAQGLAMLDSRTTVHSVVADTAREMGVPYAVNNIFLDSEPDAAIVADRLVAAAKSASRFGKAVTIGHVQPETYKGIIEALPLVKAEGVRLAYLWEVLNVPQPPTMDAPVADAPVDDGAAVNAAIVDAPEADTAVVNVPVVDATMAVADPSDSSEEEGALLNDADAVE